jgi:hypothetical protein
MTDTLDESDPEGSSTRRDDDMRFEIGLGGGGNVRKS